MVILQNVCVVGGDRAHALYIRKGGSGSVGCAHALYIRKGFRTNVPTRGTHACARVRTHARTHARTHTHTHTHTHSLTHSLTHTRGLCCVVCDNVRTSHVACPPPFPPPPSPVGRPGDRTLNTRHRGHTETAPLASLPTGCVHA